MDERKAKNSDERNADNDRYWNGPQLHSDSRLTLSIRVSEKRKAKRGKGKVESIS